MSERKRGGLLAMTAGVFLATPVVEVASAAPEHFEHGGHNGWVLDGRYNHGHFYPVIGASVRVLPEGYRPYFWGGRSFYFAGGVWYAPGAAGFVVVRPPAGLVVSVLPAYYSTVWIGGLPYYYANEVYYTWDPARNGYVVVDPPAGADHPAAGPDSAREDLIIYPKNGQSTDQQAADRYECHRWANSQTRFDPTLPDGGLPSNEADAGRSAYHRAMSACLTGRGYEVQ